MSFNEKTRQPVPVPETKCLVYVYIDEKSRFIVNPHRQLRSQRKMEKVIKRVDTKRKEKKKLLDFTMFCWNKFITKNGFVDSFLCFDFPSL